MSPIIVTLMLAVGGNVSASLYKPIVAFLSEGVITIFTAILLPLVVAITAFNVVSAFSPSIKLNKFSDFAQSTLKWIMGIIVTTFGFFVTVQGITSACYDGISFRVAKYAITNSLPLIGGLLRDGFDIVVAGSIIIKNAIGIASIFGLFYYVLSPVLYLGVFSLLLKLTTALIEPITDARVCNFCVTIEKTVTYLTAVLLAVGIMAFVMLILMTISASAFL